MKTPISAVHHGLQLIAITLGKPVSEVTKRDWRKARAANLGLPCGLTTAEAHARIIGGWKALTTQAEDAPRIRPIVEEGQYVSGNSTLSRGDGSVVLQWTKTDAERESKAQEMERVLARLEDKVPVRKGLIRPPKETVEDFLAVYPLGDPHIGMYSWAKETGADWDTAIATRLFGGAIEHLTRRGVPAHRGLVLSLGDFFHTDTPDNRTRRSGHHLDVDGRQPQVMEAGLDIMVHQVDAALKVHQVVDVICVLGNHDDVTSMFLSMALRRHFRNEPRVTIHPSVKRFHYLEFGKNLIGTTHGDGPKGRDLGEIMAAEERQAWGRVENCYWYTGHIHQSSKIELRGATAESFRTLAPRDAWAAGYAYRSGRDMNQILIHKEFGEWTRNIVTAGYLEKAYLGSL